MALLLYATETEIRDELNSPDPKLLKEAARAYRARGDALRADGRLPAAQADASRADKLEAEARKPAKAAKRPPEPAEAPSTGQILLVNDWTGPVDVVVDGTNHTVAAGERKAITRPAGDFAYEVAVAQHQGKARVEAGKTFTIRIGPR